MLKALLNALIPSSCAACSQLVGSGKLSFICSSCESELPKHIWPISTLIPCVKSGWYLLPYVGLGGSLIRAGKYGRRELLLQELGKILAQAALNAELPECDLIVPAPAPWRRLIQRGFSAPEIFAAELSASLEIPYARAMKRSWTPMQAGLEASERAANVSGAYKLTKKGKSLVSGATVLLVDDVITTGATVSECSETLLLAGAEAVHVVTLASVVI